LFYIAVPHRRQLVALKQTFNQRQRIDENGHFQTFTLPIPSDMLTTTFYIGGLKDELGRRWCNR